MDVFGACLSELEKSAAKIVRETSNAVTRLGRKPIGVAKYLEKMRNGTMGWKFAARAEGEGDPDQGWPPSKKDPRGGAPSASRGDVGRVNVQGFTFPVIRT